MTVDLRSDTVTKPTQAMYEAMAAAPLGDDVLGDEPTVARLERLAAERTGKAAAMFVPSGTMGNQIGVLTQTSPGDSILVEDEAHVLYYECAATAALAGVQARSAVTEGGVPEPGAFMARALTRSDHTPGTTLVCLENTHNRAGGSVIPIDVHHEIAEAARARGMRVHLDGARIFNAAVALGVDVREITRHVDTVTFCLSKGLCSPVGSLLCGDSATIAKARSWRKRLGGAMRQSGLLAACGIVSLEAMVDRLAEDHRRCRVLADALEGRPGLDVVAPQTNILMLDTAEPADRWQEGLEAHGVRTFAVGPHRLRAVFHHDVDDAGLDHAISVFVRLADSGLS